MSETFFENPVYVYISLGLAELVLAAIWHERRSRRVAWMMLIPLVLAIGVAVVEHLVVTDREQIIAAAGEMADAVEADQPDRIAEHIDDDFSCRAPLLSLSITKADVVALAKTKILTHDITSVKLAKMDVEVAGRTANMHVVTMVRYGGKEGAKTPLTWDVVWIKRQSGWRVLEVTGLRHGI